jgi:hypothetical protein
MNVFFYFGKSSIGNRAYHSSVCLADGFAELGINCYSDYDNYQQGIGKEFLIKKDLNHPMSEADIVIIHYSIYQREPDADKLLIKLNQKPRKYVTVFLDDFDGVRTPGFRKGAQTCDCVLKCHYNKKYNYPKNFHPWQFGISNRIINAISPLAYEERTAQIVVNFRAKHQLRDYVNSLIKPIITKELEWNTEKENFSAETLPEEELFFYEQTGGRHSSNYYKRLSNSFACACYGGVFAIPIGNYNKYTAKLARVINDVVSLYAWDRVRQWDSWRLWEAWVAACCVVHVDFEKYGCVLPVMPQNGIHYLGIDINKIQKFQKTAHKDVFEEIGLKGREFALANYSPQIVSERLLKMLNL